MATKQATKVALAGTQPKSLSVGLIAETGTWSAGATLSLSAGDVIQMVKVPKGATPVYLFVNGSTVSGSKVIKVGDGINTGRYVAGGSISVGGFSQITMGTGVTYVPYTYSTDDTIDILLSVLSISASAATGGYNLTVIFSMDA